MDDAVTIIKQVLAWRSEGHSVALATVIKTWGSAPRRIGSMMCINTQMQFEGSVSGGCVETAVIDQAINTIKTGQGQLLEFGVSNEQAWEVGLACGGNIEVFVKPITDEDVEHFSRLVALNQHNDAALVLTQLDQQSELEVLSIDQIIDHAQLSDKELAHNSLRQDRPLIIADDGGRFFIQPINPDLNVFIVGAVHISQQLVPIINQLGFNIFVVDPRGAFASAERFPGINLVKQWPNEYFSNAVLNHRSAVIALTHDPKFDDPALLAALNSNAFYIGALGSRKTHAGRIERLKREGVMDEQLSRIHAPIGLDIYATNPTEIALSIASELVFELRKSD